MLKRNQNPAPRPQVPQHAPKKKGARDTVVARKVFTPQPGPQTGFMTSPADIVIYGGGAGGGKSFGLLLETTRHSGDPTFGAVVFRRTYPQIMQQGGLWDTAEEIFPALGAVSNKTAATWTFPGGARVTFAHMQHEKTKLEWQGSAIPLVCFDELTHFTESMFFYMLSRNRTPTGCTVRPYIRATCNPDADSWVAKFIAWWIDQDTGYPVPDRSGKIRWFIRVNDQLVWADTKQELIATYGVDPNDPKSVTFIPARLADNQELMRRDPAYAGNLRALPLVEQERLLGGNWKIRPAAGMFFKRIKFKPGVRPRNEDVKGWIRYWDRAATPEPGENGGSLGSDPDYTVGVLMAWCHDNSIHVVDVVRFRGGPYEVKAQIKATAESDAVLCGDRYSIGVEQDPGSAGKSEAFDLVQHLAGYRVTAYPATKDKVTRAGPFSSQVMGGNVWYVPGPWNDAYFSELEGFPDALHDDQVDASSGAFNALAAIHNLPAPLLQAPTVDLSQMVAPPPTQHQHLWQPGQPGSGMTYPGWTPPPP